MAKPPIALLSGACAAAGYLVAQPEPACLSVATAFAGTSLAVAAASCLNMYLERDTDARMLRTRRRPLAAGRLPARAALIQGGGLASAGLFLLARLSWTAFWLTAASLILYDFVYTPLKRRTPWAFAVGILPGAAPPLIGWSAATGSLAGGGLWLFGLFLVWQIPHILAIYIYLEPDYARAGIPVLPGRLGLRRTLWVSLFFCALLPAIGIVFAGLHLPWKGTVAGAAIGGIWLFRENAKCLWARDLPAWARAYKRATLVYISAAMTALIMALAPRLV